MCGDSYVLSSIPAWNTLLLPLGYLGTAAPAGIAAYIICTYTKEKPDRFLGIVLATCGILAAVSAALFVLTSGADALIGFGVCVLVGGIIPVVMGVFLKTQTARAFALVSLICASGGVFAFRCLMWMSGEHLYSLFGTVF
jgi:anaerobic dimethyl sulfoxide reductase subunit C (anchor subunit)